MTNSKMYEIKVKQFELIETKEQEKKGFIKSQVTKTYSNGIYKLVHKTIGDGNDFCYSSYIVTKLDKDMPSIHAKHRYDDNNNETNEVVATVNTTCYSIGDIGFVEDVAKNLLIAVQCAKMIEDLLNK